MGTKTFNNYEDLLTFTRASGGHALRPVSYGTEQSPNATFTGNIDGWRALNANATATAENNELKVVTTDISGAILDTAMTLEVGKIYFFTATSTSATVTHGIRIGTTGNASQDVYNNVNQTGPTTFTHVFVATSANLYVYLRNTGGAGTVTWDNVSVKEVTFDESDGTLTLFEHPNNVPRVEWDAQRNRLGLLVEEARTNLLTYSTLDSNWLNSDSTDTANQAIAPDGTQTATLVVDTTANANHYITSPNATIASGAVTGSMYVKRESISYVRLRLDATSGNRRAWFDIENGTVGSADANAIATMQDVGNGWYRLSLTEPDNTNSGTAKLQFFLNTADGETSYIGDGSGAYVWGAQLEAGSFPTSYIKTTGATATRSADIASINTADFGYNSAEGTVVCEFNIKYDDGGSGFPRVWEIGNSSSSADRINVYIGEQYGTLSFGINTNIASVAGNNLKVGTGGSVQSTVAMGWAKDNVGVSDDGDSALTDSNADILPTAFSRNRLKIGGAANTASDNISGHIKSIKYYPRKLTNAQIEDLSS